MTILSEIKQFVKKFIKSPVLAAGAAYLIYKIISKKISKESLCESIKVVQKDGQFEIIYDDTINSYIVIDGRGVHNDTIPAKSIQDAKAIIQKLKRGKNSYQNSEKINKLYESVCNA